MLAHPGSCRLRPVIALTLTVACDQIAGIDDYRVGSKPTDASAPITYLASPACVQCIATRCTKQLTRCSELEDCQAGYDCTRGCTDIACNRDCNLAWPADAIEGLRPLYTCTSEQCMEACNLGRNFTCVGRYTHPERYQLGEGVDIRIPVSVGDYPGTHAEGVRVTACSPAGFGWCEPPGVAETVVTDFAATLALRMTPTGWYGAVDFTDERSLVSGPDGGALHSLLPAAKMHTSPLLGGGFDNDGMVLPTREIFEYYLSSSPTPTRFEPDRGYLQVLARDCNDNGARDLELVLNPPQEGVWITYWGGSPELPSWTLDRTTLAGKVSAGSLQPDQGVTVELREKESGRVFSCAQVVPKSGAFVFLAMHPRSESQPCTQ